MFLNCILKEGAYGAFTGKFSAPIEASRLRFSTGKLGKSVALEQGGSQALLSRLSASCQNDKLDAGLAGEAAHVAGVAPCPPCLGPHLGH